MESETLTESKHTSETRQDRLWFLESMDRINRAIQGTDDFEQMNHVLDAVLSIFGCDRAWIGYPCDAESRTWRMTAERTRAGFSGGSSLSGDLPMDAESAHMHRVVGFSEAAVRWGSGTHQSIPSEIAKRFGVQSQICLAVHPKIDKPYIFGLDQCTRARIWTEQEEQLFEATGQRLAAMLTSLLMSRDLQESKARLEEAQRVAHVGYWVWDLTTNRVIWSDETYRIFGLSPQDGPMDLAKVLEMLHPEDRAAVSRTAEEAVLGGARPESEHRIVCPTGEVRIVHSQGDVKRDASGQAFQMFGTVQDITDRKRAEEALRRTEVHFREGQRLAHMGSWTSDGSSCSWSDELFEIYGFDPCHGVPTTEQFLAIHHPQDRASVADALKMMHEQNRGCDVTARIVRSDGELRHIRCVGIPVVEQGEFKGFRGVGMDVTEHELLTRELRREQSYLNEAQSLAHIGSWATNFATGQIHHNSDETIRLHGFDPRQGPPPLERFYNTIHPEDEPAVKATLENAVRTRTDYDIREYRICRPDGTIRFLRSLGHHDPSQEIGEYVGITMDITDRKRAEEEREKLRRLEADLAHINRVNMLGELAAALAHEIKQPIAASITSANACLRWLAHEPPDLERARAAAARMERDANRAADVINSLRSFYKTGTPAIRTIVDVKDVIREMTILLASEATRHSIVISTELAADLPNIPADRVQLQQVFMNLMLNAIEAMKDLGGELTIRSDVNPEGQLLISISDTGVGLPAESAERIFDPFHTTKPQGTGMGLAVTRSIVEAYGGRVWATANPGRGASFYFTLPREAETQG